MTHKQQADELIKKFLPYANPNSGEANWNSAKKCALIAVELMIKLFDGLHKPEYTAFDVYEPYQYPHDGCNDKYLNGYEMQFYWQAVKAEIEKL